MTISIINNKIMFKTYEKDMNLYLYIPPSSAHPPGILHSLIHGRIKAYYNQNSNTKNFHIQIIKLIQRLVNRGHDINTLKQLTLNALQKITNTNNTNIQNTSNNNEDKKTIFFHLPYHPRGIQRQEIRKHYTNTLNRVLNTTRTLTVAISRPKNLGDSLCHTRLPNLHGKNPSHVIQQALLNEIMEQPTQLQN